VSVTLTGLTDGQSYTPGATALVGDQDGSEAGWDSSGQGTGTPLSTKSWGLSGPSIANITTNSAGYTFSGLDTSGVVSYELMINHVSQGVVNTQPSSPIHLSGLNSNTAYTVGLKLHESSCASPEIGDATFDTLPVAPTTPASLGPVTSN